jgi:hypothetical protein
LGKTCPCAPRSSSGPATLQVHGPPGPACRQASYTRTTITGENPAQVEAGEQVEPAEQAQHGVDALGHALPGRRDLGHSVDVQNGFPITYGKAIMSRQKVPSKAALSSILEMYSTNMSSNAN